MARTKIGRSWRKLDIKIPNKQFIEKDKPKESFKPRNTNEKRKFHKCGGMGNLANHCLKKEEKINVIVETGEHNDKEEESYSEIENEESQAFEIDEIYIINSQINNLACIYEVLDINSNLPQIGISDTSLTNIQDAKLNRTKPAKGMGYTA
ncbi:hypothetical protein O181_009196 [Austropuccinia psidii MF-1]|uniref:Uncharacterized protein n=1 Tax=Austropuccinia psidii MF-1 TaxID=1389203 RepID=A0A9Q3GJ89_9BASI|nr:hypothetical protein [Austropuccinia psidii MF-1]